MTETQILYYCRAKSCDFHLVVSKRDRDKGTDIWKKDVLELENHAKKRHPNLLRDNPEWASIVGVFVSHGHDLDERAIQGVLAGKRVAEVW